LVSAQNTNSSNETSTSTTNLTETGAIGCSSWSQLCFTGVSANAGYIGDGTILRCAQYCTSTYGNISVVGIYNMGHACECFGSLCPTMYFSNRSIPPGCELSLYDTTQVLALAPPPTPPLPIPPLGPCVYNVKGYIFDVSSLASVTNMTGYPYIITYCNNLPSNICPGASVSPICSVGVPNRGMGSFNSLTTSLLTSLNTGFPIGLELRYSGGDDGITTTISITCSNPPPGIANGYLTFSYGTVFSFYKNDPAGCYIAQSTPTLTETDNGKIDQSHLLGIVLGVPISVIAMIVIIFILRYFYRKQQKPSSMSRIESDKEHSDSQNYQPPDEQPSSSDQAAVDFQKETELRPGLNQEKANS